MTLEQPLTIPISDKDYRLVADYRYECFADPHPVQQIHIKEGFVFDGASVPRICWTLTGIRPDGLLRAASLVHDFIYRHKGSVPEYSHQYGHARGLVPANHYWTRQEADKLFCRMMREAGVSKFKRRLAYYSVRSFGWMSWPD